MNRVKEEILERVEAICGKSTPESDDLDFIWSLCESRDPELRLRAAEALGIIPSCDKNIELLKRLAADRDELVCAEAMDSIAVKGDFSCLDVLKRGADSDSSMIRGYSCSSSAELCRRTGQAGDSTVNWLKSLLFTEEDEWVKTNIYGGLALLGRKEYLEVLRERLESEDFYIQSTAGSLLELIGEYDA